MLKYSPTSSNEASAQLAGQSEPTSTEGVARERVERDVDVEGRATERAAGFVLFRARRGVARQREGLQQREEDIFAFVVGLVGRGWVALQREAERV